MEELLLGDEIRNSDGTKYVIVNIRNSHLDPSIRFVTIINESIMRILMIVSSISESGFYKTGRHFEEVEELFNKIGNID